MPSVKLEWQFVDLMRWQAGGKLQLRMNIGRYVSNPVYIGLNHVVVDNAKGIRIKLRRREFLQLKK